MRNNFISFRVKRIFYNDQVTIIFVNFFLNIENNFLDIQWRNPRDCPAEHTLKTADLRYHPTMLLDTSVYLCIHSHVNLVAYAKRRLIFLALQIIFPQNTKI